MREAVRREPGIASVGNDSWAVDYGLVSADEVWGEPFHYRDERTRAGVERVHAVVPFAELYRRNGLQFLPFNTLYQYVTDTRLTDADAALLIPDLVAYLLTGAVVAERTNASTTGLLRVDSGVWDEELASASGSRHPLCPRSSTPAPGSGHSWRGARARRCGAAGGRRGLARHRVRRRRGADGGPGDRRVHLVRHLGTRRGSNSRSPCRRMPRGRRTSRTRPASTAG